MIDNIDDNNDDETDFSIGLSLMFEGGEATTLKHYEFMSSSSDSSHSYRVALRVVDDNPGSIQSGRYLWKAALALSEYLVHYNAKPESIIELGAGCALPSILSSQLFIDTLKLLAITDYDPGTLQTAKLNFHTTIENLHDHTMRDKILSLPSLQFRSLQWGACGIFQQPPSTKKNDDTFDLILGSDLISSTDIVQPLLQTVRALFHQNHRRTSIFLLAQSFPYDHDTIARIQHFCSDLDLNQRIVQDGLFDDYSDTNAGGGCRIIEFSDQKIYNNKDPCKPTKLCL